jgi:single-stranded-DNA-specific exonuclease
MLPRFRWLARPAPPSTFIQALPHGLPPLVGRLLWNRGVREPDAVAPFLNADYDDLHDARLLHGMDRAVVRVQQAIQRRERVAVYGDYDTDGVTGVALLKQVLTALDLDVLPYIPHRINEGYGLNIDAVERLARDVQLLITVDCGISNVDEIGRAQALGLDVVVLDHHTPPAVLPPAYALVNPHLHDCRYPFKGLAGVGVAYKLVQALHRAGVRLPLRGRDLLDVVALGTVADMMPLQNENRILVKHGLAAINSTERPGLRALIEAAAVDRAVDARTIGFALGPRLNAAGRLGDATHAYRLLLAGTHGEAQQIAHELNALNTERQQLTQRLLEHAQQLVIDGGKAHDRIIVLHDDAFVAGVVGLVAARLVEQFRRPVLVLERGEHTSRGSARSVSGFSLIDTLSELQDLFDKFGGHTMAAGFTIRNDRLPQFEAQLQRIATRDLHDDLLTPQLHIDAELRLDQVRLDLLSELALLEPFGHGNAEPIWATRGLRIVDLRRVGRQQQHLKLRLTDGRAVVDALWWRAAEHAAPIGDWRAVDVAYTLGVDKWNNQRKVRLEVQDLRPASA